jgi:hypothetical protein
MLIDVIAVHPRKLLKYVLFVLSTHLLLVTALLHSAVDLGLYLLLHIRGHVRMVFELAHPVHIVLLLVQLEWVKSMLLLLLVVNI